MSNTVTKAQAFLPQELSSERIKLVALGSAREGRSLDGDLMNRITGQLNSLLEYQYNSHDPEALA
jgi:hypothetical protein